VPPRLRAAILGLVGFFTLITALGMAFSPYLLVEHPLVLLALAPEAQFLALAAANADPWLLFAITVPRRVIALAVTYGFGVLYGPVTIAWMLGRMPRLGRLLRWLERQQRRLGAPLLFLLPNYSLSMLAGSVGTPLRAALGAILLGQIVQTAATLYFGQLLSIWTQLLLDWLAERLVLATLICALVIGLQRLWAARERLWGRASP